MRAYEFIGEDISLTYLKPQIADYIRGAIKKCFRVITRRHYNSKDGMIADMEQQLQLLGNKISENIWQMDITLRFEPMEKESKRGHALRTMIVLNQSFIDSLSSKILQHFKNLIDFKSDITSNDIVNNPFVDSIIEDITEVIIHELVHIHQHDAQPKNKPTEYRSYLTRDKEQFYDAVRKLESEQDWRLYLSSPQEIPAFAHNFTLQLIRYLWDGSIEDIKNVDIATRLIDSIDKIFTWNNVLGGMKAHRMYSRFKTPGTKEYKVFKKFMTIAYKELQAFKRLIQDRLSELQGDIDWNYL